MSNDTNEHQARSVPQGVRRGRRGRFESALPGDGLKGVLLHLDHDLLAVLDARAAAAGETRSVLVRRLLGQALKCVSEPVAAPQVVAPSQVQQSSPSPRPKLMFTTRDSG